MGGISGINSVPVDYFLRGVEAAKEAEARTVGNSGGQPSGAPATAAAKTARAESLVQQLDVLLLRAAKSTTRSLEWRGMAPKVQALVQASVLTPAAAREIEKAANAATGTFKALGTLTGEQLAQAVRVGKNGRAALDTSTKAGLLVVAAIRAQEDLANMFAVVGKRLWSATDVPDQLANAFVEYRQICDRRATEIQSLAFQMHDFSMHAAAEGRNVDPNVTTLLKATAQELLPRQALAMHGTPEALEQLNRQFTEELRPLAARIDAFVKDPSAAISSQELESLRSDIERMKAAVHDVRLYGLEVPGGSVMVPKDVLTGLESVLGYAEKTFANARRAVADVVRQNMFNTIKGLFGLSEARMDEIVNQEPDAYGLLKMGADFQNAVEDYLVAASKSETSDETRKAFANARRKADELRMGAWYVIDKFDSFKQLGDDFAAYLATARGAPTFMPPFEDVARRLQGDAKNYLSGAEAQAVFDGRVEVSSLVEARVRGLRDGDVNPATGDANLVSATHLGAGNAGRVFALTYANGETFVFKGEAESRNGLARLMVGSGKAYSLGQKTVNLNIASRTAADRLGCGDVIVKYSAGMHDGIFGFFMEKAPGMSVKDYFEDPDKAPAGGLSSNEVRALPPGERRKIRAEINRQLNRLQWLDTITGQLDRHYNNYFIHIDRNTHAVTVKGIDNDASFSPIRTGTGRFELDASRSENFVVKVKELAGKITTDQADLLAEKLLEDPGVEKRPDGTYAVDLGKLHQPILAGILSKVTGMQTGIVPNRIDRALYDELMKIKDDAEKRREFLNDLRDRIDPNALEALERRLDDVIGQAVQLAKEKEVVERDGWMDVEDPPRFQGRLSLEFQNGLSVDLPKGVSSLAIDALSESMFVRDELDDLF